jgi:hypothetical protein
VKPRIAFIGVRSSWLTLVRNRVFASLARAQRLVGLAQAVRQAALPLEGRREPVAGPVQVLRQRPELVPVRHLHPLAEAALGQRRQPALDLLHRQHERPGEQEAEQQRGGDARRGERQHDLLQQAVVGVEGRRGGVHPLLGVLDERHPERPARVGGRPAAGAEHVLDDVRGRVLLLQVPALGQRRPAAGERAVDLRAGAGVGGVRSGELGVECVVLRVECAQLRDPLPEEQLAVGDLGVPGGRVRVALVVGEQRHRPVVALRGDVVEQLLGEVDLLRLAVEGDHALVHPVDHHEAERGEPDQEERAGEEAHQQLVVHAQPEPRDRVDGRSEPAGGAGQRGLRG